jgi:aminoglycoside phosphotransferase (APT) family kinase protein
VREAQVSEVSPNGLWMDILLGGERLAVELIGQGRTAEVYAWGESQVVKLFHAGRPADWIRHEAEIGHVLSHAGVPAPMVGNIVQVNGRTGLVYERVAGVPLLTFLAARPWRVLWAARLMADLHTRIHACHADGLPTLRDRLEWMIEGAPVAPEVREAALARLSRLPDGGAVCHGDFHPDNIILSANGPVVLDWSNAVRGDPPADVARTLLMLRIGGLPPGMRGRAAVTLLRATLHRAYLRRYLHARASQRGAVRADVDRWMLPVAVARAQERIDDEQARLRALIARHLS